MLKIAGSPGSEKVPLDGFPIPLDKKSLDAPESGEHVNGMTLLRYLHDARDHADSSASLYTAEFWGRAIPEGKYGKIG